METNKMIDSVSNFFSNLQISKKSNGEWVAASNGEVPEKAVLAGSNFKGPIFVARAIYDRELFPGKLIPSYGRCFISVNGEETSMKNYEVLCNCVSVWVKIGPGDSIPKNAIPGGVDMQSDPYYIGRVEIKGTTTVGKVDKKSKCYVLYQKKEHVYETFDILVLAEHGIKIENAKPARLGKQLEAPKPGPGNNGLELEVLKITDKDYITVADSMNNTIVKHHGSISSDFSTYNILKIEKVWNKPLYFKYKHRLERIKDENNGNGNEKMLFHGSNYWKQIIDKGFDERPAKGDGMFGAGVYFAEHSSKSNQYIFGLQNHNKCPTHKDVSCYVCERHLIVCKVALGKISEHTSENRVAHAPQGHHSIKGVVGSKLKYPEYVIYRGEQALPKFLITFKIVQ